MIPENLKPSEISDIVYRMDEYLMAMRSMERDDAMEFLNFLEDYVHEYFDNHASDPLKLKILIVEFVDIIYQLTVNLDKRDIHTDGYFGIVISRLFFGFQQKGILAFFVVDNSLRDDRFKMVVELFKGVGFITIYPYSVKELHYSDEYTVLPILDYKSVEKQIDESKAQNRHIFYLEKDDSVNYLNHVLAMAEEFQFKYTCIFRNKAPDGATKAICLMGSFSDYLKMNQ